MEIARLTSRPSPQDEAKDVPFPYPILPALRASQLSYETSGQPRGRTVSLPGLVETRKERTR
jgi:hypothetical protein